MKIRTVCGLVGFLLLGGVAAAASGPVAQIPDYVFVNDTQLGGPGFWDYLTYDPVGKRVYASHVHKISVFDPVSGKTIGEVGPFGDAHGVAIVSELGKGYADSGHEGVLKVFSLTDLHIGKEIKVSPDADGVVYDERTRKVMIVAGDAHNLTIVDPDADAIDHVVSLGGKPEFLTVDHRGFAYVNLADVKAVAKVDIARGKVVATWPLENCETPHGIDYDPKTDRLFSGCANARLVVMDASTGKNLANLPIGPQSDAVVVDSERGLVFSANGTGSLTVISESRGDYHVARTIPTFFGGRNMTIDPATGDLFISHGDMKIVSPTTDLLALRFGWDGLDVAMFRPNN